MKEGKNQLGPKSSQNPPSRRRTGIPLHSQRASRALTLSSAPTALSGVATDPFCWGGGGRQEDPAGFRGGLQVPTSGWVNPAQQSRAPQQELALPLPLPGNPSSCRLAGWH